MVESNLISFLIRTFYQMNFMISMLIIKSSKCQSPKETYG